MYVAAIAKRQRHGLRHLACADAAFWFGPGWSGTSPQLESEPGDTPPSFNPCGGDENPSTCQQNHSEVILRPSFAWRKFAQIQVPAELACNETFMHAPQPSYRARQLLVVARTDSQAKLGPKHSPAILKPRFLIRWIGRVGEDARNRCVEVVDCLQHLHCQVDGESAEPLAVQ